jgi:hypothetical protein
MRNVRTFVIAGVVAATLPACANSVSLRPGKYAVTSELEMAGGVKVPGMQQEQCITADDLKDFSKPMLSKEMESCKVSDYKVDGNKITFNAQCSQGGVASTMAAETTFTADTYTSVVKLKSPAMGGEMTMKATAKRVGDCTK